MTGIDVKVAEINTSSDLPKSLHEQEEGWQLHWLPLQIPARAYSYLFQWQLTENNHKPNPALLEIISNTSGLHYTCR